MRMHKQGGGAEGEGVREADSLLSREPDKDTGINPRILGS